MVGIKLSIFSLMMLSCLILSAQDSTRIIDRVFTVEGKVYTGHIIEDHKGDYLLIESVDDKSNLVLYHDIIRIQHDVANVNSTTTRTEDTGGSGLARHDDNELITFNGYSASSHVTDKLVKKRNTGIVLTILGAGLLSAGIVLAVTTPSQTSNNGYGGTIVTPGVGTLAGVAMIIGGIGITIPGIFIWGRASANIRRAQLRTL